MSRKGTDTESHPELITSLFCILQEAVNTGLNRLLLLAITGDVRRVWGCLLGGRRDLS